MATVAMAVSMAPVPSTALETKIVRRVEIAKLSRMLQARLALAAFKNKHGLESLSFDEVAARLSRAPHSSAGPRPGSVLSSSESSFYSAEGSIHDLPPAASSPSRRLPLDDDDANTALIHPRKRARFSDEYLGPTPPVSSAQKPRSSNARKTLRAQRAALGSGSVRQRGILDSSPLDAHSLNHSSFLSAASTLPESPTPPVSGPFADPHGPTLPAIYCGSPPRTPPPTRPRGARLRQARGGSSVGATGENEGADLLLHLAHSPARGHVHADLDDPKSSAATTDLSSAFDLLRTPPPRRPTSTYSPDVDFGRAGHLAMNAANGAFATPKFNFAEFLHVTPSPAQGAFGSAARTPGRGAGSTALGAGSAGVALTPLAAKEARKRLNFDALAGSGSPSAERSVRSGKGLGMELGPELSLAG